MKQTIKPTKICLRQSESYCSELFAKYKNDIKNT